ncbi:MAG: dockerin type I repeat-containing protein [Clostridia bacterium]|nr:dockerin type I repeat-containing protein [Clostridia bacterium]
MNMKKLFALVLSLVFICSSFLVVSAETPAASVTAVEVTVTESGLTLNAIVPADAVAANPELAVTFTQNDEATAVTEYTEAGASYIYSFAGAAADVTVTVGEDTIVCTAARFANAEVGAKFAVYAALTAGDANADATTDIKDVVRVKRIIANDETVEETDAADLDGDKSVVAADLVLLAKYIITGKKGIAANTVTFMADEATVLDVVSVPAGFKAIPTVVPTANAEGAKFAGWNKSLAGIEEDTVITAVYDASISGTVPDDWEYDEEVQP